MKAIFLFTLLLLATSGFSQVLDSSGYIIEVTKATDSFFTRDKTWRGADGAASINLGNGKVLWLFSDGFISKDASGSRRNSRMIRNSIAIQDGYDLKTATINYYWDKSKGQPKPFFYKPGKYWFWTGHGTMIKDKLIIFLMEMKGVKTGLGFDAIGWYAVLVSNPFDDPALWKMKYIKGPETFGTIAGSATVLKDGQFLYAYGSVEPATHEVYVMRWNLEDAYNGILSKPEWWINDTWQQRSTKLPIPNPLFIGQTEYSVHYDALLRKFIQIQSFGFGEAEIGFRLSDHIEGPWTEPLMIYKPDYPGVRKPFMYSVKAHPHLEGDGLYITYNVNSFDFGELVENQSIYFPKFILLKIKGKAEK